MKHLNTLLLTALAALQAMPPAWAALDPNWQNPEAKFAASKSSTDTKQVTWRYTNNVQKECEAESHKRKLGGFGYAKEYHVERYFREAMLLRIAPISIQLIMCHIAEKVLGLPKSY